MPTASLHRPLLLLLLLLPLLALGLVSCSNGGGGADGGAALLAAIGGPPPLADGTFDYDLTIAFTNDIHDQVLPIDGGRGGLARMATVMRLLREQAAARGTGLLAMNAGDNFEGSLFYENDGGALVFRLLEAMRYDVVQVGNHDHQFGAQRLYDVITAAFPQLDQQLRFLWGNVNPSEMSAIGTDPMAVQAAFLPRQVEPEVIDAFENAFVDFATGAVDPALMDAPVTNSKLFNQTLFFDVAGIRVGVFGMDTDEILYRSVPGQADLFIGPSQDGLAENLRFYPADHPYASAMVAYLDDPDGNPSTDDGADLIVCVTHLGLAADQLLAQTAVAPNGRRIDVVVGGHSHTRINDAIVITHAGGGETRIVQAGALGEFVGRIDLSVDPTTHVVVCRNVELIQVDGRFPDDAAAAELVRERLEGPGGVDAAFGAPFSTVVGQNCQCLPGIDQFATSSLGGLVADAALAVGNSPANDLGLDAFVLGSFVMRRDLRRGPLTIGDLQAAIPLHALDATGLQSDAIDFVDLPGGLRLASDPSTLGLGTIADITALEYLLEIIYSVEDILAVLQNFIESAFGIDVSGIGEIGGFINGLQWSGIEFVVDEAGPILDRIDPSTIVVGGVPLVGNEASSWRIGFNSILARIALPFVGFFALIEEPIGVGVPTASFPAYDPVANASGVVLWEALRDHVATIQTVDAAVVRITGSRPRTLGPDLTLNPFDAVFTPARAAPGSTVHLALPIVNVGETGVLDAQVALALDPTPDLITDNPDGLTDGITGFSLTPLATIALGPVPPWSAGVAGMTVLDLSFAVPAGLPPGTYPVIVTISAVVSSDPVRPETVTTNNGGADLPLLLPIE